MHQCGKKVIIAELSPINKLSIDPFLIYTDCCSVLEFMSSFRNFSIKMTNFAFRGEIFAIFGGRFILYMDILRVFLQTFINICKKFTFLTTFFTIFQGNFAFCPALGSGWVDLNCYMFSV